MKPKSHARDLIVGAVVLLAAFIFTIGIFSIGSEQRIWVRKVTYRIRVPDANGLQSGSPVRLAGVQVGTVTDVRFPDDPNMTGIDVGIAVDQAHQHRIREDTQAHLKILTLLGGEKYVEISPGLPSKPLLPPGSYIDVPESFGMEQLGELSASLTDDLKSISANVRVILETVQKQEGVVGRMLLDPNFGQHTFDDIAASARLTREALERVNSGRGLAGRLLTDEQFARETLGSLKESVAKIETLLTKATAQDGVLSQALDPDGKVAVAMDRMAQAASDVQDFTSDLKEGRGTIGRLTGDEAYARELLENVRKVAANLAAITERLNEGEGTLGLMLKDPQLYQDISNVVRGVQKSRIVGGLIRHYRRKGEEDLEKEMERLRREEEDSQRRQQDPNGAQPEDGAPTEGSPGAASDDSPGGD